MKHIRVNRALGRQAKIFFIDVEHMPAIIVSAIIAFFLGQVAGSEDWMVPILIFLGCFGSWMITVRKNPKSFVANFHKGYPPKWKRGYVYYSHPLKKSRTK